ncbi:hypothetical protein [Haloarcula amylovorans]|uniref:hypothetical protein n=1 Tax=Haloarcula amylovorans TaxID=2562280 RepID=UPI001075FA9A|nr:hypothetical protein [Halomicroarcula amylolytica]
MDVARSTTTLRQRTRLTGHARQPDTVEANVTVPGVGEVNNTIVGGAAALFVGVFLLTRLGGDGPSVTIS